MCTESNIVAEFITDSIRSIAEITSTSMSTVAIVLCVIIPILFLPIIISMVILPTILIFGGFIFLFVFLCCLGCNLNRKKSKDGIKLELNRVES